MNVKTKKEKGIRYIMWERPTLENSLEHLVFARILGRYKPDDPLSIYLDVDYLKKKNIYLEVKVHEWTHLHLMTSTTIGHALMFLASSGLRCLRGYKDLYTNLMLMSWEAQEGAATLTEWQAVETTKPDTTISKFQDTLPPDYKIAFDIFNSISQTVLAPECYWMKHILANALAQFAMNIDIIPRLTILITQDKIMEKDIGNFLNSVSGHPQKRIKSVQMALGEPNSTIRNLRCEQIYERLKEYG